MMLNRNRSNLDDRKVKYKGAIKLPAVENRWGRRCVGCGEEDAGRLWRIVGKKMRCGEEDAGRLRSMLGF
ncbi:hypothetical protein Hanom_Chr11g01032361 [Helianthus anomalus]